MAVVVLHTYLSVTVRDAVILQAGMTVQRGRKRNLDCT